MKTYEQRHAVTFEETNALGNVYFVNHLRWQGRCRERFLQEHAPSLMQELRRDLRLVTLSCSCQYLAELEPFDTVVTRMWLAEQVQNRIHLRFDYYRSSPHAEELVARGEQQIACMRQTEKGLEPVALPIDLARALEPFKQ